MEAILQGKGSDRAEEAKHEIQLEIRLRGTADEGLDMIQLRRWWVANEDWNTRLKIRVGKLLADRANDSL